MKRDMNLIIEILKMIESDVDPLENPDIVIDEQYYNYMQIQFNIALMMDADLIKAHTLSAENEIYYHIDRLTWNGHEFLDAAKNELILDNAKSIAQKQGAKLFDLPFEIVKALIIQSAKDLFLG